MWALRTFNLFSMLYPGLRNWIRTYRVLYFWKLDPDPHGSLNSGDLKAQNGAMDGHGRLKWRHEGSKWSPGWSED